MSRRAVTWGLVATLAYCAAASLGYWLGRLSTNSEASAVWPAIAIGIVILYLGGLRMAWSIVVGGLLALLLRGAALDVSIANGLVSTVNPLAIVVILRALHFEPDLGRLRNTLVLIVAAPLATPLGATLGTATIVASDDETASVGLTWLTWWTGDFAGTLLVAPILFEVAGRIRRHQTLVPSPLRTGSLFLVATGVATLVFRQDAPVAFLVIPVLVWAGLLGDALTTAVVNAVVAGVAAVATVAGSGPFAGADITRDLLLLAVFTPTVGVSSLVLCAIAGERQHARVQVEATAAELAVNRDELRESRARIVQAADSERRLIARDLHDRLQARLVLLALRMGLLRVEGPAADDAQEIEQGLQAAITELREVVQGVMPAALTERGLRAAIEDLVDRVPIRTELSLDGTSGRYPDSIESTGYYIVSEAITNAIKHARARTLSIRAEQLDGALRVEIQDDGVGGASTAAGSGLRGIADRVDAVGGRLWVESRPGAGTRVVGELPL